MARAKDLIEWQKKREAYALSKHGEVGKGPFSKVIIAQEEETRHFVPVSSPQNQATKASAELASAVEQTVLAQAKRIKLKRSNAFYINTDDDIAVDEDLGKLDEDIEKQLSKLGAKKKERDIDKLYSALKEKGFGEVESAYYTHVTEDALGVTNPDYHSESDN